MIALRFSGLKRCKPSASALALLCVFASLTGWAKTKETSLFTLADPGRETIVHYEQYGDFVHRGTAQYRYIISDRPGLSRAVGEGIYPNVASLLKDPGYQAFQHQGKLEGGVWDFVNT